MRNRIQMRGKIAGIIAMSVACACADVPKPRPDVNYFGGARIAAVRPPFDVEPTRHETFEGALSFSAGVRLRFASFSMSEHEQLRLQRCGEQCSTAKLVHSWSKADFQKSQPQEVVLEESGDYYLWLRKELPNGEVGAERAAAASFDRENGILRFASGTVIFVAIDGTGMPVDRPDDPARIGTEPILDEKSELRKLEWAGILEKARHGVRQDLIVQIDPGETVNALLRESGLMPGDVEPPDQATISRRKDAFSRYRAALSDVKLKMLAALQRSGVEMKQDFDVIAIVMVSLSSEDALRALQSSAWVTVISENHRMVVS